MTLFFILARWSTCAIPLGIFAMLASAADNLDRFEAGIAGDAKEGQLPYRLLKPKNYDAGKKYPLVLFFHGAGERGNDNRKQLIHGMKEFASDAMMDKYPCFVLAPQCPEGQQWVDAPWSADAHQMAKEPTKAFRQSLALVEALQKQFSIDSTRVYVTGLSMGGFGAWEAVQRRPDLFAAAIPICGGGDPAYAKNVAQTAVWAFHGADDDAVKPSRTEAMIAAVTPLSKRVKVTIYANTGHDSWSKTYSDPKVLDWLFAQKKVGAN